MPTCPRCAFVALVFAVAAFAGCDSSNPGRDLDVIDGTYTLQELSFDPATPSLPTADVGARLDLDATTLEVFGGDGEGEIRVRYRDGQPSRRIQLVVGATRGRATFEGETQDDIDDLRDLFLPAEFVLTYDSDLANTLSGTYNQSGVDLQAFDPEVYLDQRNNRGTLTVRFRRP